MKRPEFIISTSRRLSGARLSLAGQWGNQPFDNPEMAEAEARRLGGSDIIIKWERSR